VSELKAPPGMPESVKELISNTLKCPRGHALPHHTAAGDCTPLYCAYPPVRNPRPKALVADLHPHGKTERKDLQALEVRRVDLASDRADARKKYLKTPDGLTGPEAESYVTRKMVDLTPMAVAELEFQLMLGDDKARMDAARDVLDRAGFGKKESGGIAAGPLLLINVGGGQVDLPWLKRAAGTTVLQRPPDAAPAPVVINPVKIESTEPLRGADPNFAVRQPKPIDAEK
jgi:hypothetical protein